jgi:hypothetical protein
VERAHALATRHKRFNGAALVLALLTTPLAFQAATITLATEPYPPEENTDSSQHIEQPDMKVKADTNEKSQASVQNEVKVESNSESSSENSGSNQVDVTINGQKVPVPENGSVHKRMTSNGSETVVDVQVDGQSSSHSSSSSSTSITVNQHSSNTSNDNDERSDIY